MSVNLGRLTRDSKLALARNLDAWHPLCMCLHLTLTNKHVNKYVYYVEMVPKMSPDFCWLACPLSSFSFSCFLLSLSFVSVYALPYMHFIVTSWVASRQRVQWESILHGAFRCISTPGHFSNESLKKPQL